MIYNFPVSNFAFSKFWRKLFFEDGRIVLSRGRVFIISAAIFAQVIGVGTIIEARNSHQMQ